MSQLAISLRAAVAVGLLSTAAVTVGPPVSAPQPPTVWLPGIALTAGADITLDLVRHGQSVDNVEQILGTVAPGAPLTAEGQEQADTVAQTLFDRYGPDGIDGIYASGLIRTQETAAPLADLEGMTIQNLSGLNELNAGILEGAHQNDLSGLAYIAAPLLWTLGLYFVPEAGSSDYNGMAFESRVSDAVQTIYDNADSGGSNQVAVAYSHAATLMIWTMMNVKNPDPLLILTNQLDNTGVIELTGNPSDGWTLLSWNGTAIDPVPSLGTELFVDVRNLIVAPQMALYNLWEALLTFDSQQVFDALQAGLLDVVTTTLNFPVAVIDSIIGSFTGADAVDLLPADVGSIIVEAFAGI